MATISGFCEADIRIVIIDTTTWLVEVNEVTTERADYSYSGLTSNLKIVLFVQSSGEIISYGNITPTN